MEKEMIPQTIIDPPALVRLADDLGELASQINAEHARCEAAMEQGLQHARNIGQMLLTAKGKVPHGEWLGWLKASTKVSARTAQRYMRVANRWEIIQAKSDTVSHLTEALKAVSEEDGNLGLVEKAEAEGEHLDAMQAEAMLRLSALKAILDNPEATLPELV